jgi:NAD+ kinase
MRVILLGSGERHGVLTAVEQLRPEIDKYCEVVLSDFRDERDLTDVDADIVITFGGDGSVLRATHQMGMRQRPMLTVNMGTLGFLSNVRPDELISILQQPDLLSWQITEHLLLRCRVYRKSGDTVTMLTDSICLNEVMIQGGTPFKINHIDLLIDGEPITTYSCDGLILSTPVGSTAHNLSAGGPILRKDLRVVVLSPISAHTLSHRPVVDSAERIFELKTRDPFAYVVIDGTVVTQIIPDDTVSIQKANETFKLITIPNRTDYKKLQEKLGWSGSAIIK